MAFFASSLDVLVLHYDGSLRLPCRLLVCTVFTQRQARVSRAAQARTQSPFLRPLGHYRTCLPLLLGAEFPLLCVLLLNGSQAILLRLALSLNLVHLSR